MIYGSFFYSENPIPYDSTLRGKMNDFDLAIPFIQLMKVLNEWNLGYSHIKRKMKITNNVTAERWGHRKVF